MASRSRSVRKSSSRRTSSRCTSTIRTASGWKSPPTWTATRRTSMSSAPSGCTTTRCARSSPRGARTAAGSNRCSPACRTSSRCIAAPTDPIRRAKSSARLLRALSPHEDVQSAADEVARGDGLLERLLPAHGFGLADGADFGGRLPGALGEIGVEAAGFTLERHEGLCLYRLDAERAEDGGQLAHQPAVDGRVVRLRRDYAPRELVIGMRDEETVAVEIEDADATADARDAHHLANRRVDPRHVRKHGRGKHDVETAIGKRELAAVTRAPVDAPGDARFLGIVARQVEERRARIQPDHAAPIAHPASNGACKHAAAAADIEDAFALGRRDQIEV